MTTAPTDMQALQAAILDEVRGLLEAQAPGAELPELTPKAPEREEHGDLSIPCFPLARVLRKAPQVIATDLAESLGSVPWLAGAEAVNGFLNLRYDPAAYFEAALGPVLRDGEGYGRAASSTGRRVMVEFSSPNTNKPQHLGHIRNNLLGATIANLLEACGDDVVRANLVNDRGIHICKSMLAYRDRGEGRTPAGEGIKGDLFVGNYYVLFERESSADQARIREELAAQGVTDEKEQKREAESRSRWMKDARELLRSWEAGDDETVALWERMNGWVYEGFDQTYGRLGIRFDRTYHESETYKLGKATVLEAVSRGVCQEQEDGSVWVDFTSEGMDRKLLLRSDGTSVYMTQDIGTAQLKQRDYGLDRSIYVVGSEQDYHFKILFKTLGKMGFEWADGLQHLSYGMVFLPDGKMKSREGKVVDADELMESVVVSVRQRMLERDEELRTGTDGHEPRECATAVAEHSERALQEMQAISEAVGMGALKFYMLKFGARKDFTFQPDESISLQGDTGPYVQFAFTRVMGILRKAGVADTAFGAPPMEEAEFGSLGNPEERTLARLLGRYPSEVTQAADNLNPAAICAYLLQVAQSFHRFVHDHQVLGTDDAGLRSGRLCLCIAAATVLKNGLGLLGIDAPQRM